MKYDLKLLLYNIYFQSKSINYNVIGFLSLNVFILIKSSLTHKHSCHFLLSTQTVLSLSKFCLLFYY